MGNSILSSLCLPIVDLCKRSTDDDDEPLSLPDTKTGKRLNFEFAFNDADFSDRVLNIEIMDDSFDSVVEVQTLHISSLLLAGNSPFFHKLFKNGGRESNQRDVTLTISASEKSSVMEVLNFMYTNTLTSPDVLGVLLVADKYEASDCVRYCAELLRKMPISLDSSLRYLELPPSVLMYEEVQPLIEAAKKCLLAHYKYINKSEEEVMALSLSAFAALLESDRLLADLSGDDVYEIILKWARAHYPQLDKRREILAKNLIKFIRFRHMSSSKLKEVLVCPDLDREEVSKLILEAFIMVVEDPDIGQIIHTSSKYRVVKVEQHGTPQPHCVVYFDIKKEDCKDLFPSNRLSSQSFRLGGQSFYLAARCILREGRHSFGMYLSMTKGSQSCLVGFEFNAMSKSSMKFQFQNKTKGKVTYSDTLLSWGYADLFKMTWTDFMSKDCDYFIDGILHLRADVTIKDS